MLHLRSLLLAGVSSLSVADLGEEALLKLANALRHVLLAIFLRLDNTQRFHSLVSRALAGSSPGSDGSGAKSRPPDPQ